MGVIYDKSAILVLRSIPALFARTTCTPACCPIIKNGRWIKASEVGMRVFVEVKVLLRLQNGDPTCGDAIRRIDLNNSIFHRSNCL